MPPVEFLRSAAAEVTDAAAAAFAAVVEAVAELDENAAESISTAPLLTSDGAETRRGSSISDCG